MKPNIKIFVKGMVIGLLGLATVIFAAPYYSFQRTILPESGTNDIGTSTKAFREVVAQFYTATSTTATSTFSGDLKIGTLSKIYQGTFPFMTSSSTGAGNFSIGADTSLLMNERGALYNTFVGYQAGKDLLTGAGNTGVGWRALANIVGTYYNTAVGTDALMTNTSSENTAVGHQALRLSTAADNTAIGAYTLQANTTGIQNVGVGVSVLKADTTGGYNTAVGYEALMTSTSTDQNTAFGFQALRLNATGNGNTAIGSQVLAKNTYGLYNTALGAFVLDENLTGNYNTGIGVDTLGSNTTGNSNTTVGENTFRRNVSGSFNAHLGEGSYIWNIDGARNTSIGDRAMIFNTSGSKNICVGMYCGIGNDSTVDVYTPASAPTANTTGSENIWIGYMAGPATTDQLQGSIALGNEAHPSRSYQTVIGATSTLETVIPYGNVGIGTTSPTYSKLYVVPTARTTAFNAGDVTTWADLSIIQTGDNSNTASGIRFKTKADASNTGVGIAAVQEITGSSAWGMAFIADGQGTNPAEAMRITGSNGYVGIGTTSPVAKLEVTDGKLRLSNGEVGSGSYVIELESNYSSTNTFNMNFLDIPFFQYDNNTNSPVTLGRTSSNVIIPYRLGVGTTTFNNLFNLYSTTKADIGFSGASGDTNKWTMGYDVTNARFAISSSTVLGGSDRLQIDGAGTVIIGTGTTGNFGVGTSTTYGSGTTGNINLAGSVVGNSSGKAPGNSASGQIISNFFQNFNNSTGMVLRKTATGAGDYLSVEQADSTSLFMIKSTGLIGINQVAPTALLHIASTSPSLDMFRIDGATNFLTVKSSGKTGVGTTSPATALDVNGTITQLTVKSCSLGLTTDALGSITGCVVSDEKLKTNITSLTDGNPILKLNPVFYNWKDPKSRDAQLHTGFVAQQVAKVIPTAVVDAGTGLKGVDSNSILSYVVKFLQDFYASFQKLVARVAGVEQKLDAQQKQIDAMQLQINNLTK